MRRSPARHLARLLAASMLAFVPAGLGTVAAVLYTSAGNSALGRLAGQELTRLMRGQFEISRVTGSFLGSIELDDVVIRDSLGQPFATVTRITARYIVPNLLAGRFVFSDLLLDEPDVRIIKRLNGRINYQEIFRLGEGPPGGSSPLIELRNIRVRDGHVQLRLPWSPADTATTPQMVAAALEEDRARPGRVILATPDGLRRVVELDALNGRLPLLRISSPDGAPLTLDIDSLSTRVSDPAVHLVDLGAHLWTRGDSLAFTADRAALPNSRFSGGGVLTWPRGPVLYDFTLDAPRLDLRDLHWISPAFPALTGHTLVTARSRSDQLNAFALQNLDLHGPLGRITGSVTALVDQRRGVGVEDMAVDLTDLDLDVPRPYLDTMPLSGTLTGHLEGTGFKDGLDLDANLVFTDSAVAGGASTSLAGAGRVILGGPEGAVFDTMVVSAADIDMRTVALIAPAVRLRGRLQLAGVLHGSWRNITYEGALTHRDGDHPESHATGTATLDTRTATFGFQTRMSVNPLVFDGVRPSYPGIPVLGAVNGVVAAAGTSNRFHLDTDLRGDLGVLSVAGTLMPDSLRIGAESLTARFSSLDLARVLGRGLHTSLAGRLTATGIYDTLTGPTGALQLRLEGGNVEEFSLDSLHARLRGADGLLVVDTLQLAWRGGELAGRGGVPWRGPGDQQVHMSFSGDSLESLEPLVERFAGPPPADSGSAPGPIHGRMAGEMDLLGSARAPRLVGWVRGEGMMWRGVRSPALAVAFGYNDAERPEVGASLNADSIIIGSWVITDITATAGGYRDSLRWSASGGLREMVSVAGAGQWWRQGEESVLGVDSLVARLPRHVWALRAPATVTARGGRLDLTDIALDASDGSGSVRLTGSVPRSATGNLAVSLLGVEVPDVYALLELDTVGIAGTIQLDLAVGGTASQPTLQGTGSLSDLSFGELGSPFVQGIVNYADRKLDANLLMWKTGTPVLRLEANLPLDLALKSVPQRQIAGPILVRAIADSTDLGVIEAFTRNLRKVRGTLRANVEIGGTWDRPSPGGQFEIRGAAATIPGLGVRYENLTAGAHFVGDSAVIDSLSVRSGEGSLRVTGGIRLERLTRPILNLALRARRFRAIDTKRFLTLDASGDVRLTGPVFQARLTGRVTADAGNLHFADLLTKRIVDLENPGDSGLIDLNLIRTEKLGANFQSRFLDSLAIDDLQVRMGETFWLRSSEANIQLDGELTVNKVRDRYRYDGTLNALRGNYALRIGGFVTRDFTVDRGTVRYFGTPDLNADLDIEASHVVIAVENNEEIPVIARITGTLLQPKLELTTTPTPQRPAISQTELVSYLMFGRPTFSLQGQGSQGQYAAVQAGVSYLAGAFSTELQRTLITDLGVPIDFLDIRTGAAGAGIGGNSGSAQVAQVAAGWQIGRKWFVGVVADLCTNTQRFYPNAEFRISRQLRLKSSVEPSYSCQAAQLRPDLSTNKYQVGLDLLWEKDY